MTNHPSIRRLTPWGMSLLLLALTLTMAATDRPAPRIGVVDANRINQESAVIREKIRVLSQPAEKIQLQMIDKKKQLEAAVEEYQAQSSAMAESARQQKTKQIEQLRSDINTLSKDYNKAFNQAINNPSGENLASIQQQIMKVVATLGAERQLDVVLSTEGVLYTAPQADLTAEVIRRIDASGH